MTDDRKNDGKELKDEDLDKVSGGTGGGVKAGTARAGSGGGGRSPDTLSVKKVGDPYP